jgi:hypothetical protein
MHAFTILSIGHGLPPLYFQTIGSSRPDFTWDVYDGQISTGLEPNGFRQG